MSKEEGRGDFEEMEREVRGLLRVGLSVPGGSSLASAASKPSRELLWGKNEALKSYL